MNFSWWFSKKIAFGKSNKNNLSTIIIRIGQIAVTIGIVVALITISTGIGARKGIKQKLADFNGHITIKPYNSNVSFNSDSINLNQDFYPNFNSVPEVVHIQAIATRGGVIRTEDNFSGVILKGVGSDFDVLRFEKFIIKGKFPKINDEEYSDEVLMPEKIAKELKLDIDSSFVTYFIQEDSKPIYRRFKISGIFKTDIKNFDDIFIIGDIKHIQRINKWDKNTIGSFEVFTNDVEKLKEISLKLNENIPFNLQAQSAESSFAQISDWVEIFDTNIFMVIFIMLIVVIINMIMVLLILILERTQSIGLLKTFGASNWQIRKIFIYYALFIMLPGLFFGNIIGLGLLLAQKYFEIIRLPAENYYLSVAPVYLDATYIILLNACSLIICAVVLLLPSYLISKIEPVKAIKMD